MSDDVWLDWDDSGHDPLAAPDPPRDVDREAFIERCEELLARWEAEDEPRIDTDWWADGES